MLKRVSCEYPGYVELVPTRREKILGSIRDRKLIRPRYLTISVMFFLSFFQFGATAPQSALVSLAAYCLMILPLGTRHIERMALIAFVVAMIGWLEIIPASLADAIHNRIVACR